MHFGKKIYRHLRIARTFVGKSYNAIWSYNFGASIFMETYGNHTSPCEHENAMKIFSVYTESKIEFGWNLIK